MDLHYNNPEWSTPKCLKEIALTDILTVEAKGIGDDVTVVWVRSPTGRSEARGSAYQAKKIRYFSCSQVRMPN